MSDTQQPEILSKAVELIDDKKNIHVEYIGNFDKYHPVKMCENGFTKLSGSFSHKAFIKYMLENVDIGFVSLKNDYLGACIPSKIYEYINLGLPIIGALPDGDAKRLIEDNEFGFCTHYSDLDGISKSIDKLSNNSKLFNKIKNNVISERAKWSMEYRMQEIIRGINDLI